MQFSECVFYFIPFFLCSCRKYSFVAAGLNPMNCYKVTKNVSGGQVNWNIGIILLDNKVKWILNWIEQSIKKNKLLKPYKCWEWNSKWFDAATHTNNVVMTAAKPKYDQLWFIISSDSKADADFSFDTKDFSNWILANLHSILCAAPKMCHAYI